MAEGTGSGVYQALKNVEVRVNDIVNGTMVVLPGVLDVSVSLQRNEPMQWTVVLDNTYRDFTRGNPSSPYQAYMNPVKAYRWTIKGKVDNGAGVEEEKEWTYLAAIDYTTNSDANGGYTVTISGTDNSWLLFQENQTMPTWRSTTGNTVMAKVIIQDICNKFGVPYDLSGFMDYPVRWLHLQGEIPMDIIKQVLAVRWAEWRMDGQTFKAYQPIFMLPTGASIPSGPSTVTYLIGDPQWTLTDRKTIESLGYGIHRWNVCTSVSVRRTSEASRILFEEEGSNTTEHSINFNGDFSTIGAIGVNITAECINGTIEQLYLWPEVDKGGTGVLYGGPNWGATKYKCVSFFFQYTAGLPPGSPIYYHIVGKGDLPLTVDGIEETPSNEFSVKYKNETLEVYIGEPRPARDPVINSLIPTIEVAHEYAIAFIRENARKLETVSGNIGFHPLMKPGETVAIEELGSGFSGSDVGSRFFLESVNHSFASGSTSITATKYRNDTITLVPKPVTP